MIRGDGRELRGQKHKHHNESNKKGKHQGKFGDTVKEEAPPLKYLVDIEEANKVLEDKKYQREYDLLNFEDLEGSSQYFWYSPVPNLQKKEAQINTQKQRDLGARSLTNMDQNQIFNNNGLSLRDKIEMNWVDVPLEKQKISISRHRYLNGGTTQAKNNQQIVVDSGECNWRFKFKIVSVERITKIFDEIQDPVATDNLETEPSNVTLTYEKVVNKLGSKELKELKKH